MLNKYIKLFMDDHSLKVGDEFRAKGLNISRTWYFDENGYLLDSMDNEESEILTKFLLSEWEVEKVQKGPWKPEYSELFWYVCEYGDVASMTNCGYEAEKYMLNHLLVFKTEEEAEDYKWFLDKIDEYKRPFELEKRNYCFYYDNEDKRICTTFDMSCQNQGSIYFGYEENIDKFLEEVGEERIKKYMFGVYD